MARILGNTTSKVKLADRRSETVMVLHYKEPTTEQHLGYQNVCVQRIGKAVVANHAATRIKFGKEIFAGFDTGAFARVDDNGKAVEFSCDPKDQTYFENWRQYVEDHAPDILQLLAEFVFESAMSLGAPNVSEDPDQD